MATLVIMPKYGRGSQVYISYYIKKPPCLNTVYRVNVGKR